MCVFLFVFFVRDGSPATQAGLQSPITVPQRGSGKGTSEVHKYTSQVRAFDDRAFDDMYATKLKSPSCVTNKDIP